MRFAAKSSTHNSMPNPPNPPDPLDPLLDRWSEQPEPSPSMAPEVWRRIAKAEKARRRPGEFWSDLDALLSRPAFAAMFVTSCALLGLFLAEVRLNRQQREHSAALARSYLQLIDPLLNPKPAERLP
jgi:hypothetical protein